MSCRDEGPTSLRPHPQTICWPSPPLPEPGSWDTLRASSALPPQHPAPTLSKGVAAHSTPVGSSDATRWSCSTGSRSAPRSATAPDRGSTAQTQTGIAEASCRRWSCRSIQSVIPQFGAAARKPVGLQSAPTADRYKAIQPKTVERLSPIVSATNSTRRPPWMASTARTRISSKVLWSRARASRRAIPKDARNPRKVQLLSEQLVCPLTSKAPYFRTKRITLFL